MRIHRLAGSGLHFTLLLVLLSSLWVGISIQASAQDLDLPLRVVETAKIDRVSDIVSSGVPMPREQWLRDPGVLGLYDESNREIPAQFKVLSRWDGKAHDTRKPIKWLLVTFQTDMTSESTRTFRLRRGSGVKPALPVAVVEKSGSVEVNTGPMQVTVSRTAFNLFDTLKVNGKQIVHSNSYAGFTVRDHTGKIFRSSGAAPESVVVEEAGPVRAVIRVEGQHFSGGKSLLRYIVRIHAYAGKQYVRVFYSMRNDESYGYKTPAGHAYLSDVYVDLKCNFGILLRSTFNDESYVLAPGQFRILEQDMAGADDTAKVKDTNLNLHDNFIRRIRDENGKLLVELGGKDGGTEVGRDPGFMDLGNEHAGVTVGMRHFWQNFPKSMVGFSDGTFRIGILPEFGYYVDPGYYGKTSPPAGAEDDYTFGGGRQKTHEIFLQFRTRPMSQSRVREEIHAFNHPLFATAPASWYALSQAIQVMMDARDWENQPGFPRDLGADFNRFERFQAAKWNPAAVDVQPLLGRVTYKAFRQRGGPYGGSQFYGWMNYGDTPWGGGYCQGHYDWPFSTLLSFVRTEERELLELGVAMTRHRMDIDQYHTLKDRSNINGGQRFEKGQHHGDMTVPPTPSHTWIHGLLLYWALTGDDYAREAAQESLDFYRAYWSRVGPPFYSLGTEARTGGWSLMGLTELYDYLGETEALDIAAKIVTAFINHEKEENTSGYYMCNRDYIMAWMYGIYLNGLGKYYFHTGQRDEEARGLLDRMGAWFTSNQNGFGPLVGGTGLDTAYQPYAMWYRWHPDPQKRKDVPRVNMIHIIDGLAYAYMATGKDVYLDTAIRCATDLWRYWTLTTEFVDRRNQAQYEPITMRPTTFPNTESKILGWMTRYGKVLNYATYMREAMPPIMVEVLPRGSATGPSVLRFRISRNRPIFSSASTRTYAGCIRANNVEQTSVVCRYFNRTETPFTETWYAPFLLLPGQNLNLDVKVWDLPWVHQVKTQIKGENQE